MLVLAGWTTVDSAILKFTCARSGYKQAPRGANWQNSLYGEFPHTHTTDQREEGITRRVGDDRLFHGLIQKTISFSCHGVANTGVPSALPRIWPSPGLLWCPRSVDGVSSLFCFFHREFNESLVVLLIPHLIVTYTYLYIHCSQHPRDGTKFVSLLLRHSTLWQKLDRSIQSVNSAKCRLLLIIRIGLVDHYGLARRLSCLLTAVHSKSDASWPCTNYHWPQLSAGGRFNSQHSAAILGWFPSTRVSETINLADVVQPCTRFHSPFKTNRRAKTNLRRLIKHLARMTRPTYIPKLHIFFQPHNPRTLSIRVYQYKTTGSRAL